jgi:hypothetical protein
VTGAVHPPAFLPCILAFWKQYLAHLIALDDNEGYYLGQASREVGLTAARKPGEHDEDWMGGGLVSVPQSLLDLGNVLVQCVSHQARIPEDYTRCALADNTKARQVLTAKRD